MRFARTRYMLDNDHVCVRPTSNELYPDDKLRKSQIRAADSRYEVALITFLNRYTWSTAPKCYVGWATSTSSFERSVRQRNEKRYKKDFKIYLDKQPLSGCFLINLRR